MNKTTAKTPLLNDVVSRLREMTRGMRKGDRLPTVRALVKDLGVSQVTVANAINLLREEGLLVSHVGRGTFFAGDAGGSDAPLKSRRIIILKEDYPSRRDESISQELHRRCAADGHRSLIVTYSDEAHAIEMLRASPAADAYVLQTPTVPMPVGLLSEIQKHTRAIVALTSSVSGLDVDVIGVNYTRSIELALRHLIDLGHRDICFATGEQLQRIQWRVMAFKSMHALAELGPDDPFFVGKTERGESSSVRMQALISEVLQRDGRLPATAMLVWSYASAMGVLQACREHGVRVPEDLSLVVADNPDIDARHSEMLTMVGRLTSRMVESAYNRLMRRIEHPDEPFASVLEDSQLVLRHSTQAI